MNYIKMLDESFKAAGYCEGKLEFLAEHVFQFTTYESEVASLMAKKALEVCSAISHLNTFNYISKEEHNLWYLIMVNMPFFKDKIDWGCSIRGAWWYGDSLKGEVCTCELVGEGMEWKTVSFNLEHWIQFIDAMQEWVYETD